MTKTAKKSGASGIWASAALLLLLLAPAIFFINDETGARIAALRKDGLVTEATVTGKRIVEEPYTDRKGRTKTTTANYIDLTYDSQTSQTWQEWLASNEKTQPAAPGAPMSSYAYRGTTAEYDAVQPGDKVPVVINRYERTRADLAAYVKDFSSRTMQIAAALCALLGLICGYAAWRTRTRS